MDGAPKPAVTAGQPECERVRSSRTGMRFAPLMPIDRWKAVGARIAFYSEATAWWLGDWLVFGKSKYGRRYKEGIALTGLDYQTLRNYAVVARRYPLTRRRADLSFQHHAELCALPDELQDLWLDRAALHRWSKTELRQRVRAAADTAAGHASSTMVHLVVELQRNERWRQAATCSGCALEVWMTIALDAAAAATLGKADESLTAARSPG